LKVLKWLLDPEAPLSFRPRLDIHQWLWIARFMADCLPYRARRHTTEIVRMATESRGLIQEVRTNERLQYDQRSQGILHFYRDPREFESAVQVAELMRRYKCNRTVVDRARILEIEPAFAERIGDIVGATYTAEDESGDALKYTQQLAGVCKRMGADFRYDADAVALHTGAEKTITGVEIQDARGYATLRARDYVVSMGAYSAPFLRRYGVRLNIYPAKGYSVTIPIDRSNAAPVTSLTDDECKLVYSNFGDRLRVAGTAELSGYSRDLNHTRCQAIVNNVKRLFPRAGRFEAATFWSGLRPATPSNLPHVGRTRYRNLWLNTGHGTLGWTLAAGSGSRIADMIAANDGPTVA
jgi:D-amino-acid dehydrogenase